MKPLTRFAIFLLTLQSLVAAAEKFNEGASLFYYLALTVILLLVTWGETKRASVAIFMPILVTQTLSTIIQFTQKYDPNALVDLSRLYLCFLTFNFGYLVASIKGSESTLARIGTITVVTSIVGQIIASALGLRFAPKGVQLEDYRFALVGLTKHPAITAALIVSAIPLVLLRADRRAQILTALAAAFAAAATYRRSAWLAMSLGSAPIFLSLVTKRRNVIGITVGALVAISISLVIIPTALTTVSEVGPMRVVASRIDDVLESHGTASGRKLFWPLAVGLFERGTAIDKLFGIGQTELYLFMRTSFGMEIGAHNDFLNILLVNGIFSVIAYLSLLGNLLFRILNIGEWSTGKPDRLIALGAFLALMAISVATGGIFEPQYIFFHLFFGWILGRKYYMEKVQIKL
jgi:hypothetical protein